MNKHDILVKYESVQYEESHFSQESYKQTKHSRIVHLFIVVIELEQVSILVLVGHVNDQD